MKSILLLHGAIGAKDQFQALKNILETKYLVYTMNFSGHGGKSFADHFSINQFTQEIFTFLEKEQLNKVYLFGYSMGGYVALNFAQQFPEKVQKIITLATKFDWTPETAIKEGKMLNPEKIEAKIPAFAAQLQKRHAPNDWRKVLTLTVKLLRELGENNLLKPSVLNTINIETKICLGEMDRMVTKEESERVATGLPKGHFEILAETPHPLEKVKVDRLVALIQEFFN